MIVSARDDFGERIARCAGTPYDPSTDTNISRIEHGELYGGAIYTAYHEVSIAMHVAGFRPRWLNRALLWAAFDYPFNVLGVRKVIGWVPDKSLALAFDLNLGFTIEARVEDVFASGAACIVSMTRSQCRWLHMRPGLHS